jgi:protein-S-isoprenylcysteine O-methyltransferase Ste14
VVRLSNVPVPEQNLVGIAAGLLLHRARPWRLPGPRHAHRLVGGALCAGGTALVVRSWAAAEQVELSEPDRLVTSGPYAISRNPMYVGWTLLHLGIGVVAGSAWVVATLPPAAGWVHRQVMSEERALAVSFGDEFDRYRATVVRYWL